MAALRNLVTAILCLACHARIAATLRNHAGGPAGPPDDHELLNDFAGALPAREGRTRR